MDVRITAIRPVGDSALLVELGETSPTTTASVRALARQIQSAAWPGVREVVPAYRTVLLHFDPCHREVSTYPERLAALSDVVPVEDRAEGRLVEIPVRYGGADGPDLEDVAHLAGLTPAGVVRLHASTLYTVEFLGFAPGFPYLGGLPPELAVPRLPSPRLRVPAGSVGIGGAQTSVYPLESPGGWRLIGRAVSLRFDPSRPETLPYKPGDRIRFVPVDAPALDESVQVMTSAQQLPERALPILRVLRAGLLSTVQDLGRPGWAAYGYAVAGAMDAAALVTANRLVGNEPGAAALELTMEGGEFEVLADVTLAVTGADLSPILDDEPLPMWHAYSARAGSRLSFGRRRSGCRSYLAFAGGIAVPPVLGSAATDLIARLGGIEGRALRVGDQVPGFSLPRAGLQVPHVAQPRYSETLVIRTIWGPQQDWFSPEARDCFAATLFTVSPHSDRTGLRLDGAAILPDAPRDLASEGQSLGAIQVPPNGLPLVLLADGRGVGGYPRIATVISADLPLLGQAGPGTRVRFQPVCVEYARSAAQERCDRLLALPLLPAPETEVQCLLEPLQQPPERWRCPRSFSCLVSRRCLTAGPSFGTRISSR